MNDEIPSKVDLLLKARGVQCPIPSMRVRLNMIKVPHGGIMKVITDAPHSKNSIPRYCRNFGHELLLLTDDDGVYTFIIRKRKKKRG